MSSFSRSCLFLQDLRRRSMVPTSGLLTNFHKSTVVPIRCQGIDLNAVLRNLPTRRSTFPLKYLGLPLSSSRLKKNDFQFLIDKISNKLSGCWNGKNLSTAGRLTLVKLVITSQAIYLLFALRAPKEILNLIDWRRKNPLGWVCANYGR
jgi:hypothetical protein